MRVAILSGPMPPRISGVGDHTVKLAEELRRQGHEVAIWTAEQTARKIVGIPVYFAKQPWDKEALQVLFSQLQELRFEVLIIQYTPQSIAPRTLGVSLAFPLLLARFKFEVKIPVVTFFHEMNYPVGLSLRGILIGLPHFVQMIGMVCLSDLSLFTTESFLRKARTLLPFSKRLDWLPVGANVEPNAAEKIGFSVRKFKEKYGLEGTRWVLLHFGGLHPTHLYKEMILALKKVNETFGARSACLVCVGIDQSQLEREMIRLELPLENILGTGVLPAAEVSAWMAVSELILAPFLDGVSTRRGSVMSALAHGKPVLTTWGESTQGETSWSKICSGVSVGDRSAYPECAVSLLSDSVALAKLSESARKAYEQQFCWRVIVHRLISKLSKVRR